MHGDTSTVVAHAFTEINNSITNHTSSAITVSWRVIDHNLPQSWKLYSGFGICDNITCYDTSILAGVTRVMDTIGGGQQSIFKLQINGASQNVTPTTSGPIYITSELSDGSTTDTVTFIVHKWGTSIGKVSSTAKEDVTLYPNPAYGEVNVTFSKDMGVKNVAIYNLVGKQISNYRVITNSAKLDLEKIPSGIYFLRLIDSNGRIVATRRFTHQ
ncbi:MAG TPA: T9SS type A sorting domain-containing protein, partial [Flavipsychrobacter sp.]|nr:T9SS type A sorting domain-containing protein [Flavipsychrobacter sp.]